MIDSTSKQHKLQEMYTKKSIRRIFVDTVKGMPYNQISESGANCCRYEEECDMFETFQSVRKNIMSAAVGCIVLGAAMLIFPGTFLDVACYVLGALVLAYGVIGIVGCVQDRVMRVGTIVVGVAAAALGIFIITQPKLISSILPIIFGLILLLDGIFNVRHGVGLRKFGDPSAVLVLILGIITVGFGAFILINPYTTASVTLRLIGIALLYSGISDLIILFRMERANRTYEEQQKIIDVDAHPVEDDEEDNK